MTQSQTIHIYSQIVDLTSQMLKQAKANQWDELLLTGAKYQELFEQLQSIDNDYDQAELQQKLLAEILENESAVRKLIKPELENLSNLIGNGKNRRTAIKAYYDTAKPNVN